MKNTGRISYMDIFKGGAIIFVVLQHSAGNIQWLSKFILSFHMALFFFAGGYVAHNITMKKLLKKSKRFLGAQIFIGIMNCVWYWLILEICLGQEYQQRWIDYFNTWFLPTMFWVLLLYTFWLKIMDRKWKVLTGYIILITMAYGATYLPASLDGFHLYKVPLAFCMFLFGKQVREKVESGNSFVGKKKILLICSLCIVFTVANVFNADVYWYNYSMGNFLLTLLSSVSGCLLFLIISININKSIILEWFGINSLIIYSWNFIVIRVCSLFVNHFFAWKILNSILIFISSMVILILLTIVTRRLEKYVSARMINSTDS